MDARSARDAASSRDRTSTTSVSAPSGSVISGIRLPPARWPVTRGSTNYSGVTLAEHAYASQLENGDFSGVFRYSGQSSCAPTRRLSPSRIPSATDLSGFECGAEQLNDLAAPLPEGGRRERVGAQQHGDQRGVGEVGEDGAVAAQQQLRRVVLTQTSGAHLPVEKTDRLV